MFRHILRAGALAAALCLALPAASPAAEITAADRKEVIRLMEALGGKEMIARYVHINMANIRKVRPDITPDKEPLVEREVEACVAEKFVAPGGLADRMLPILAKHFSQEELRQLVAFYESPLGRKVLTDLPRVLRDAKNAAQTQAMNMLPEVNRRVSAALAREAQAAPSPQ